MSRRNDLCDLQIEIGNKWQSQKDLGGYSTDAPMIEYILSRMHLIVYHMIQKEPLPKKAKTHARNRKAPAKAK